MATVDPVAHVLDAEEKPPVQADSRGSVEHLSDTMVELQENYVRPGIQHHRILARRTEREQDY